MTEYCKREACWARVRELEVGLPGSLEDELVTLGSRSARPTSGLQAAQPEEAGLIREISEVSGETWFTLANWAKETGNLQAWQRSLAFSLGRLAKQGREPSRRQAVQAKKILDEAGRLGFLSAAVT